jgi:hypothetical protein
MNNYDGPVLRKSSSSRLIRKFAVSQFGYDQIFTTTRIKEANITSNGLSEYPLLDKGEMAKLENRFVFECSWEVVNKGYFKTISKIENI